MISHRPRQKNFENSLIIGLALTLGVLVAGFIAWAMFLRFDAGDAMFSRMASGSMEPTLWSGDYVTSSRLARTRRSPELHRGEVIVLQLPEDSTREVVKRIIGMPATRWRCEMPEC